MNNLLLKFIYSTPARIADFAAFSLKGKGSYTTRHPGRECRDPRLAWMQAVEQRRSNCRDAMDGNPWYLAFFDCHEITLSTIFYIPVTWIPAFPAGMTSIFTCVYTYAQWRRGEFLCRSLCLKGEGDGIRGVINLRGSVVPVIDLGARFGKPPTQIGRRNCIIIIEVAIGEETQNVGVMVDAVNAVLEIPGHEIEPAPTFGTHIHADFIAGMGKVNGKFVIILNIQHVLSMDNMAALATVGSASATDLTQAG